LLGDAQRVDGGWEGVCGCVIAGARETHRKGR